MCLLLTLVALLTTAQAQTVVQGRVTDAQTGEGLAAATVQVEGTSRGTITNRTGDYEIVVPPGAAALVVRFIGYQPARRAVEGGRLDVALTPAVAELGEAIVTAGNPADNIMRRVIARKARWQAGLQTWQAEVYSRQTIRASGAVVAVVEGQTRAFWDRDRGLREVVTATRRTGNLGDLPLDAFAAAEQTLNLYDDEVPFGGYDLMGPTHPDAVSFYRFAVEGTRALGDELVYDLSFAPRNALQPGLSGQLSVLADADALIAVSARPSASVQFPLVTQFDLTLDQQFSSFGQAVDGEAIWLPVDFRMSADARAGNALLRFPDIGFAVASRLTDYAVNVAVPDSLYEREGVAVDSASVAEGLPAAGVVPLSAEEERALAEIDSTQTLTEAFRPTGPLARFINASVSVGEGGGTAAASGKTRFSYAPVVAYNRVEGARLGAELDLRRGPVQVGAEGAYQTAAQDVWARGNVTVRVAPAAWVGVEGRHDVGTLGRSLFVTPLTNSVAALAVGEDYFDYVRRDGGTVWASWWGQEGPLFPVVNGWAAYDDYRPATVETEWSLTGSLPPDNVAALLETETRSLDDLARAGVRVRLGRWVDGIEGSAFGQRGAQVWVEGGRRLPDADRDAPTFGRVEGEVRWFVPTVLRRRLLPPTLHLRLAAGTATGGLPVQRAFGIDGQLAGVSVFGALRSRTGRLTLARRYALVAWEHDFRSVPFEALGWRGAAPLGLSLQVHGAHAWADRAPGALHVEPSVVHHEVGASLGLGYTVPLRLDVTYRLTDGPGVVVGIGLARLL